MDVGTDHYTIEMSGDEGKLEAFIDLLKPMGVIETARTGSIALGREKKKL